MSSMVWQFVLFLSLIACGGTYASNNTRCFDCQDVPLPAYCSYVMECAPGQICMVEQFITSGGMVLYNSGCQSTTRCEQRARSVADDVTFSKRSDILVCQECCTSEFCNNEGCGSVSIPREQRGPQCFHCDYQDAPDRCRTVTNCDKGEVCMLAQIPATDGQGSPVYKSSCMSAAVCTTGGIFLIGKKRFTGCHTCCTDDFCNDQCDHVTVPTQPMTSLTTQSLTSLTPSTPSRTESTTPPTTRPTTTTTPTTATKQTTTTKPTTTTNPKTTTTPTTPTTPTTTTKPTTTTQPTTTSIQTTTESSKDYCNRHHYQYHGPSHLCYHFHKEHKTWDDANHQCKSEGAMLAVVDTQAKWNFLKGAISHHYHENVYIGGRDDRHPDNDFHWTNGARVTLHAWSHDQPDGGNEDCIYVSHKYHWNWHDTNCANQMAYVCTMQLP